MKTLIRLVSFTSLVFTIFIFSIIISLNKSIPTDFYTDDITNFDISLGSISSKKNNNDVVSVNENFQNGMSYNLNIFNAIPIKSINVKEVDEISLMPSGEPFGIKIITDGVLVVGESEINTKNGSKRPYKEAGIKTGDILLSIDDNTVMSNNDIKNIVSKSDGDSLKIKYISNGEVKEGNITPSFSSDDNSYKIGIWVRDSSAGIGTMTFVVPHKEIFAGLGHGVYDVDTGEVLPIREGEILDVEIIGVRKSENGSPGQLNGIFKNNKVLGDIVINSNIGIYGKLNSQHFYNNNLMQMQFKQDVQKGKAQILTTLEKGPPQLFDVNITSIDYDKSKKERNMVIEIVDDELLSKTGGIVQGMSGSPIIQNGKLVGAVTHVFVNDIKKGYGIFAENMLNMSKFVEN